MKRHAGIGLALRVVVGTGRAGAIRTVVLVVAMAVAVAAALVIAFVPAIAGHRADAVDARALRRAFSPGEETFRARTSDGSVGDRPLRRIFIAGSSTSPRPPGVDRAPQPGQVFASPALRSLLRSEPFVGSLVPGEVVGTVSSAGLTDPDELFAYVGVAPSDDLVPVAGFGGSVTLEHDPSSFIALQLALFVLVPAGGFSIVASTLSSRARSRRWDAMRSVGVPESTIGRVAATETGLVSVVGGAIGLVVFTLVRHPLTSGGVGGLRWFPGDLRLTPRIAVATIVVVAWAGARLGRRAARIRSNDSLHGHDRAVPLALRGLPLACGVAMLGAMVVLRQIGRNVYNAPILLIGALLSVGGLGLVLVPFVRAVGGVVARRSPHLAWRLGGHRTTYEPRSIVRVLAGLVALVVIGHLTFAVLADLRLVVGGDLDRIVADISVDELPPDRVTELVGLGPDGVAIGHTAFGDVDTASIVHLDCTDLERLATTPAPCLPGATYRVSGQGFPSDLEAGRTYRFETRSGDGLALEAPASSADDRFGVFDTYTILVAGAPLDDSLKIGGVRHLVDRSDLIRLEAAVARIDPYLIVNSGIEVEQVEIYDQHLAIARVGAGLGGLLATLCFLVASVDRLLERRSHTATLVAIGVPRRTLRASQIAQLLLPMVAALAAANLVGWLIGQAFLAAGGLMGGAPFDLLWQGLGPSAIALVIAAAVGAVISVPDDLVTHLRAE